MKRKVIRMHVSELRTVILLRFPALSDKLSDRELVEMWKRIKAKHPEFQHIFVFY